MRLSEINPKSYSSSELSKLGIDSSEELRIANAGYAPLETNLLGHSIYANSAFWYMHGIKELFIDKTYYFNADSSTPFIIDCGANIGLSAISFKQQYPSAQIIAFEPDPEIFAILRHNLAQFGLTDIQTINQAVWTHDNGVNFLASGGVGGRISDGDRNHTSATPSFRLRKLLNRSIDFLKIDIEGAEYSVLCDCADSLHNVKNLFVEYHSMESEEQRLGEILQIMKSAGFKYYIKEAWVNQPAPFTNRRTNLFDLQLNIFGYRI